MPTVNLTDKRVRDLQPEAKTTFLWDAKLPGFGVRITPAGTKAFVVGYRIGRRWRLTTIGRVGEMSLSAARETAKETLVTVRHGGDPVAERAARRDALTLGALLERWMKEHSEPNNRPATVAKNWAMIRLNLGGPLANTAAAEVTATDIEKLKTNLRSKPVAFNRCRALLHAAFAFAMRRELVDRNPVASVTRYREQPRDRVLSADELRRIAAALSELEAEGANPSAVLAVRLLAMTGWRISEIRGLRWEDLRPDRGEALLVETKTGTRWAAISTEALAMIAETPRRGDFVFAGRSKTGAMSYNAIVNVLNRACDRAKVADVSPHVFRASAATSMAEAGASLFALREAFGWTGLAMPNRYVKRAAQSAREAVAQHGARTAAIMAGKPAAEVLEFASVRKVQGDG
jgi:integrase